MQISKHVGRGITSDIILVSLYSWLACAEDDGVALFKGVHFPKSPNVLPVVVGRYKRGFLDIDTGSRATLRPPTTTVSQTTTTSYPTFPTFPTATITTVSNPSSTPDRTSVSTTPQSHPPEKPAAEASISTVTTETTSGGNVTDSTKETTTSAGHVISKTLTYISFIIIIAEHILFQ